MGHDPINGCSRIRSLVLEPREGISAGGRSVYCRLPVRGNSDDVSAGSQGGGAMGFRLIGEDIMKLAKSVEYCPWCGDELDEGCCDECDDRYAANDNFEPVNS